MWSFIQKHFDTKYLIGALVAIVLLFILRFASCGPKPHNPGMMDGSDVYVLHEKDSLTRVVDSLQTTIRAISIKKTIDIPGGFIDSVKSTVEPRTIIRYVSKTVPSDTVVISTPHDCPPFAFSETTVPRTDGGFFRVSGFVVCSLQKAYGLTVDAIGSPLHFDTTIYDTTFIHVTKTVTDLREKTDSTVLVTYTNSKPTFQFGAFGEYEPLFTHDLDLGLAGTLSWRDIDLYAAPQLGFSLLPTGHGVQRAVMLGVKYYFVR